MADRFYTSIAIGGQLPAQLLPEFLKVIEDEGVYLGMAGEEERTVTEETLRREIQPGAPLHLFAYEVAWGELELIESFCQAHNLTYQKQVEPRYEYSGLEVNWQPGWNQPAEVDTNGEGSPTVPLDYLKRRRKEDWTLEQIIEEVEKNRVAVPPFEIVE